MYTVGADPEVFLCDPKTGYPIPVCGLIGGTKAKPVPIPGLSEKGYAMQEDNVMLEFNIPPAHNADEFCATIRNARERLKMMLAEKGYGIYPHTVAEFKDDQLEGKQAATFGCSPDFDAYSNGAPAPRVNIKALGTQRYAGGHIHLGHDLKVPPFVMASFMDATIGLRSIIDGDAQYERRGLYGAAGRFRPTSYGLEYRVLSNYWVLNDDLMWSVAHTLDNLLCNMLAANSTTVKRWFAEIPWNDVRKAINEENMRLAASLARYINSHVFGPSQEENI